VCISWSSEILKRELLLFQNSMAPDREQRIIFYYPTWTSQNQKEILVSELKGLRNEFLFFLILRAFISETKKVFALWARN